MKNPTMIPARKVVANMRHSARNATRSESAKPLRPPRSCSKTPRMTAPLTRGPMTMASTMVAKELVNMDAGFAGSGAGTRSIGK